MKIGLIGIGLMGQALGEHLLNVGYSLTVYNRTAEKCAPLVTLGASQTLSAEEVLINTDICLLFLSDADAIEAVLDTVSASAYANCLLIQMGTIAPEQTRHIATAVKSQGGRYLECPVLGSLPEARSGKLILMGGGERVDFDTALPLLKDIGHDPQYIGELGQGATVKLAMNQLIAGLTSSFALSLALIEKENIDHEQFMQIVRDSALYAPTFDKKLTRMLQRDFTHPNFPTKHLAKDTNLFIEVAKQLNLNTQALEGIKHVLEKTLEMGLDNTDYSAIMAGISPKN
jgi:3-hydroxyisobutyrate dehydrogenase